MAVTLPNNFTATAASGPTSIAANITGSSVASNGAVGDVLLARTYTRRANAAANITGISGGAGGTWTEILVAGSTGGSFGYWWKPWVTGDATQTFTFTYTGLTTGNSGDTTLAQVTLVKGADTTTFTDVVNGLSANASQANIGPITGLTPTVDDAGVVVAGGRADDFVSVTALSGDGYTWSGSPYSTASTTGADAGMALDWANISGSPVAVTSKTFVPSGGGAQVGAGFMFSIIPTGGGAPPAAEIPILVMPQMRAR